MMVYIPVNHDVHYMINIIVFLPPTIPELQCARKSGTRFPGRIPD